MGHSDRRRSRSRDRDRRRRRKSRSRSRSRDRRRRRRSRSKSRSRSRSRDSDRRRRRRSRSKSRSTSRSRSEKSLKTTMKEIPNIAIKAEPPSGLSAAMAAAAAAKAMAAKIQNSMNMPAATPPPLAPMPTATSVEKEPYIDPLDAFMMTNTKKAKKDLNKAQSKQKEEDELRAKGLYVAPEEQDLSLDRDEEIVRDQQIHNHDVRAAERCYACKEIGHNQADCPNLTCNECGKVGHKRAQCPQYTIKIKEEAKEKKREKQKAEKRRKRAQDWSNELREKTGVQGFQALYRVLELPPRKLASLHDIKAAFRRLSLIWHPDKHPDNQEEASAKFLEIKAAYDLLEEGIRTGGKGMGGAVFSAGDLQGSTGPIQLGYAPQ